jgi:hypothetical protein
MTQTRGVGDPSILTEEVRSKMERIKELREVKANLKQELDTVNGELEELNVKVTDFFESHRIQSLKIEGLGNFYLNRALYPAIEDKEVCYNWLKKTGDYELLLSFNTNKFKAYYKERLENGQELPDGVNQFFKTDVRLRKA